MTEVNFEFITGNIEKEIERLEEYNGSKTMNSVTEGLKEYLIQLLDWIKTAIRVEHDRIQGARDSIDATLYALMSKSRIEFTDDFKRMLDHASRNAATRFCKHPPTPQRDTYTSSAVKKAADRLENLRLKLKARRADSSQQKITFVTQDSDLLYAVDILTTIAAEKAEAESSATRP